MTTAALPGVERFAALFEGERRGLPGGGLTWLDSARKAACEAFRAQGLPTIKTEGWRFTSAEALLKPEFVLAERPRTRGGFGRRALCPIVFHRIVVQNGKVQPDGDGSVYSNLPAGVSVKSLAEVLSEDPESLQKPLLQAFDKNGLPFAALAEAMFGGGIVVRIARHARLDKPLAILFDSGDSESGTPQMVHLRVLILLEEGATAEIVEESVGSGETRFWTNLLTQVVLGEGASLKHYRLLREGERGVQTSSTFVEAGRSARYESHVFNFGGEFSRSDLRVRLAQDGAECALSGLSLLRGREIVDHHTVVEHACVGSTTRQLYKAVIDGKARFVFDGLADVRPGAQKTDAWVYNKNLLLSEDSAVRTNPEFKILADDVSCKHGGTIGQLSSEALFYLRSRGVGADEARRMLVYAFGSEMIERVGLMPLREALAASLQARMPEASEGGL